MKLKTSELTGAALDWAVSKCEYQEVVSDDRFMVIFKHQQATGTGYCFSRDWAQGGPIIERESIGLVDTTMRGDGGNHSWEAHTICEDKKFGGIERFEHTGPTPLIAAMRCYVKAQLGDEVEVPEELK